MTRTDSRRAPRLSLRCPADLAVGAKRWHVALEDVGAGGCRLLAPVALRRGEAVYLSILLPGREERLTATVAWSSGGAPYRTGVEFGRAGRRAREKFLRELAAANPGLARPAPPLPNRPLPPEVVIDPCPEPTPTPRPARAQTFVDLAHSERAAGRLRAAAAWLRAALALAPEDAEITGELAKLGGPAPGSQG